MTSAHSPVLGGKLQANRAVLAVIGLAVVVAGLLVPQLLPDAPRTPWPSPAAAEPRAGDDGKPTQRVEGTTNGGSDYQPPIWPDPPDPRALLIRLGIGTVVVLGLCVVVLRLCKNWLTGMAAPRMAGGTLQMVETLALGNRCCLHLVKVGKRQVLVGMDPSGLKVVTPLPDTFEAALSELPVDEVEPASSRAGVDSVVV